MRAAIFDEHGGPGVVRIDEVEAPEAGPGEVRIAVRAASMNHLDLWVRRGLPIETTVPHIGGSDVAGVVETAGPGVDGWEAGDRVVVNPSLSCDRCEWCRAGEHSMCREFRLLGEHTQGGFAEYAVAPAENLVALPEGVAFEEAAAAGLVSVTAWRGIVSRGGVRAGERVLVTAGSGGVGTAAVQVAAVAGARVFAVTSGPENVRRVEELGADVVYDRYETDFAEAVWRDTGKRGVDLAFDSVGEAIWPELLRSLARGGRLVTYGATTGPDGATDIRQVFWKQLSIVGTTMGSRREFEEVMALVFDGRIRPAIDRVLPLDDAREAHELLEEGDVFGKLVLTP